MRAQQEEPGWKKLLSNVRQLLFSFLQHPAETSFKLLFVGMLLEISWYWKLFRRYGWKSVGVVVGIMALLILLQPTGLLDVVGHVWVVWIPLVLLGVSIILLRKHSQSRPAQATVRSVDASPPSGVFFGTGEPERSFWGKEKGPVPLVGKREELDGHVLVVGGAGSGKSSCIAIPTLRDYWHASALVVDIKGELYAKSGRPHASVFNPMNTSALGYDPFYLLRDSANPLPDIRDMALTLCPMEGAVKDPFWIQAAQNVLTGHLTYGFKNEASFTETMDVLQSVPPKKLLETEIKDRDAGRYLLQFADMDNRTLSSIMVELSNKVVAFATDPQIQAALVKPEIITPRLLEEGYDVFLQLPEYKLEQWKPMISLIVQQFSRHFEKRPDDGATPILFLLDEFARLGKMETVVHGLATLRSKHITIMPIIQSLAQLDATYGPDQRKIICDNCSYKAILGATDADSQKYFSALVGTYEREKVTTSYEGAGWFANEKGTSITTEEKPLIRPEEFAYLEDIVLLTPFGVRRVQKQPYYLNEPLVHVQPSARAPGMQEEGMRAMPGRAPSGAERETSAPTPESAGTIGSQIQKNGSLDGRSGSLGARAEPAAAAVPPFAQQHDTQEEERREQPSSSFVPRDPRGDMQPPDTCRAEQESSTRYEAALSTLAHYAPEGTPLSTIALTFAAKLPPEKQTEFLSWWQHHQNGKEGV